MSCTRRIALWSEGTRDGASRNGFLLRHGFRPLDMNLAPSVVPEEGPERLILWWQGSEPSHEQLIIMFACLLF